MRWKHKTQQRYRTVRFFAWLPVCTRIEGSKAEETRWLEWVSIRQEWLSDGRFSQWANMFFEEKIVIKENKISKHHEPQH